MKISPGWMQSKRRAPKSAPSCSTCFPKTAARSNRMLRTGPPVRSTELARPASIASLERLLSVARRCPLSGASGAMSPNGGRAGSLASLRSARREPQCAVLDSRHQDANSAAHRRQQHAPDRASAAHRPAGLRFPRGRPTAAVGARQGLRVRRYDRARGLERTATSRARCSSSTSGIPTSAPRSARW